MHALFDDRKVIDPAKALPDFGKLRRQQFSKERADTDVGKIIAASSDRCAVARIIAMFGMIKRLFHEPGERLRAALLDFSLNELDELGLQSENVERRIRLSKATERENWPLNVAR